jgi:hypothetical protein
MKFLNFFSIFALLNPDSEYGSESTNLIESGSGYETLASSLVQLFPTVRFLALIDTERPWSYLSYSRVFLVFQ